MIRELVEEQMKYRLFYIESICDDQSLIEANIRVLLFVHLITIRVYILRLRLGIQDCGVDK